jgi:hypothetical protein
MHPMSSPHRKTGKRAGLAFVLTLVALSVLGSVIPVADAAGPTGIDDVVANPTKPPFPKGIPGLR